MDHSVGECPDDLPASTALTLVLEVQFFPAVDRQEHVCNTWWSTPPDGAGVVASVKQLWLCQSQADVSALQSVCPHRRPVSETWVLVLKVVLLLT